MAQVNNIKDLYENEDLSLREISRQTGHSFKTVQKYAYQLDWSEDYLPDTEPKSYPVLGDFIPVIDEWLEDDRKIPRKQRHTIWRIFCRLRDEHGFIGSYSSVKKYIRKKRFVMNSKNSGYLPLEHALGSGQVDFGKLTAALNKARLRADRQRSEELLLASGGKLRSIPRSAVVCVESLRNRLIYRLNTGETVECYGTIAEAREKLLSDAQFLQPHRSYLVNMEYIRELGGSGIVLEGMKSPVPVPRAAAPALRAQYIEYMVHMAGGEKHGV